MMSFREAFYGKRFAPCALTELYSTYNKVGRSIAPMYDLRSIFTLGCRTSANMSLQVDLAAIDLPAVLYIIIA